MDYIKVIEGNLEEPSMGITTTDREWLIENVNFVFHCAATIKFNEPLEVATKINVQGTENILELAALMKNLKVINCLVKYNLKLNMKNIYLRTSRRLSYTLCYYSRIYLFACKE